MYTQQQLDTAVKYLVNHGMTEGHAKETVKELMDIFGMQYEDCSDKSNENLERFLTQEELGYILCDGLNGSSWFGADYFDEDNKTYKHLVKPETEFFTDELADVLVGGGKIIIFDAEDLDDDGYEKRYTLTLEDFRKALKLMRDGYPQHWADLCDDNADFWTYDAVLQLAVFGEIVYG